MGAAAGPPPAVPGPGACDRRSAPGRSAGARARPPAGGLRGGAGMCVVSGLALGVDAAGHLGALDAGGEHRGGAGLRARRRVPAHQRRPSPPHPRDRARALGVPARNAARPVAVPGPKPPHRGARRRRARGRGAGPLRRAHHRRPRARPRPRRARRPRLGRIAGGGGHERAPEGGRRDDRERGRPRGLARARPAGEGGAAAPRTPRWSRPPRPARRTSRSWPTGSARPAAELAAALSRLELDGWIGRDEAGRYLAIRAAGPRRSRVESGCEGV